MSVMRHFENDDCLSCDIEDEFRVVGYRNPVIAADLAVGDLVKHRVSGEIVEVETVEDLGRREMHLRFIEAGAVDVAEGWRNACEGHETTRGAIGDTFYCDGACVGKGAW